MNRFVFLILAVFIAHPIVAHAQDSPSRFTKQHMKSIVVSLAQALNHNSVGVQASAVQAIRQLEWEFPYEPLGELLDPLMDIVKNEESDTRVRLLAVIALDGLHSDIGDKLIETIARISKNQSMKDLCNSLIVKNDKFRSE